MTDYAKIRLALKVSETPNFDDAYLRADPEPGTDDLRPSEASASKVSCAITTGTTVEVTEFGAAPYVVVENTDDTNFVEVAYTSKEDGGASNVVQVDAGKFCVLPDVGSDLTITADTEAVVCRIFIIGA